MHFMHAVQMIFLLNVCMLITEFTFYSLTTSFYFADTSFLNSILNFKFLHSASGAIFSQHINFLIYIIISIVSTCSWNSLPLLRNSINIHCSICLSFQRDGRDDEEETRIKNVLKVMTNAVYVQLNYYKYFLLRFWACERYVSDLHMISKIDEKTWYFHQKMYIFHHVFQLWYLRRRKRYNLLIKLFFWEINKNF